MPRTLKLFAPFAAALAIAGCNAGGSASVPGMTAQSTSTDALHPAVAGAEPRTSGLSGSRARRDAVPAADLKRETSRQGVRMGRPRHRGGLQPPLVEQRFGTDRRDHRFLRQPERRLRCRRYTAAITVCRRRSSTSTIRTGSRAIIRRATRAMALRLISMWTWFRPVVQTARSISSKPTTTACLQVKRRKTKP